MAIRPPPGDFLLPSPPWGEGFGDGGTEGFPPSGLFPHLAKFYKTCYNNSGAWNMRWRCQYSVGGRPLIRIALEEAALLL